MFLKQSTAYTFRHGPFLDDTDGKTAETGLTISQADVRLSKAGGDFAQKNESSASAHDEIGYYIVALDATDTNACGELLVAVHESGALPVFKTFQVLEETIYDSLFATSAAAFDANQRVDVAKIEGSDATDQVNAACDAAMADYDAPTKAEMDSAFSTTDGKIDTVDTEIEAIKTVVDGVLVDTAVIGAAGAGLTAVPWNSAWDTEVRSECTDALADIHLDQLVASAVSATDVVDDSIVAKLVSKEATADWDDFNNTTDSLQAIRDRGDDEWTTGAGGSSPTVAEIRAEMDSNSTKLASILEDTGTTLPATLSTIDGNVDSVLEDTGTTLPATLSTISGNVDSVLVDTGTTLPATLSTIETYTDILDSATDGLAVIRDTSGHCLNILSGVISNAGTATETFNTSSWNSKNYRAVFAGLDTDGNRSGVTLSNP